MNWSQIFNIDTLSSLAIPCGIGILVVIVAYFLRRFMYIYIHKMAAKTTTQFDDIMVHETRLVTFLWCIWLGIWAAYKIANTPVEWINTENQIIGSIFVAFGVYTGIMIVMGVLKWYKVEVCTRTSSNLDDAIVGFLIIGVPVVGSALGVIAILGLLGIRSSLVNGWLAEHGAKLGILVVIAIILVLLICLLVPQFVDRAVRNAKSEQTEDEIMKRSDTLASVIDATLQVVVLFMFILMILTELGINVTAILTGAGVVGLAIGFGAQSLVKDIIAGLFIIMENQYRKGDVIKIAGVSGAVEEINLRRTVLRDTDGIYHVVPNGEIRVSSNYTKESSRVNMLISVAYETDLDRAQAVISRVGQELADDPIWKARITSPPKAIRVEELGDSGIDIRISGNTKPGCQWDVAGELRLRLKKAFDKEGIDIPYPHTKVIFGNTSPQLCPQGSDSKGGNGQIKA